MTNNDGEDDDRDNNGNDDRNDNNNAASGSGFDAPIFDPITTPRSCRGGLGDDNNGAAGAAHYVYARR